VRKLEIRVVYSQLITCNYRLDYSIALFNRVESRNGCTITR